MTVLRIRSDCNPIGWVSVPAYSAVMKATCRTSNRVFVGLPICKLRFLPQAKRLLTSVCRSISRICQRPIKLRSANNFSCQSGKLLSTADASVSISVTTDACDDVDYLASRIIGRILTNTPSSLKRCMALLEPIVEERLKRYNSNPDNELPCLPVRLLSLTTVCELTA